MSKLGVVISLKKETDILSKIKEVKDHGFECCQIVMWDMSMFTEQTAESINKAVQATGVEVSTLWAG